MATAGCSRGPDAGDLRTEVKGKLDQHFKPGLFELVGLDARAARRCPASDTGKKRLAVYYNATLKLNQGYDFGNWEGLSPGTLAQVLGATEKGIFGVKAGESRPGEVIKVYGSSTYEWVGDRWQSVDAATPGVAKVRAPGDASPAIAVQAAHRPPGRPRRHPAAGSPAVRGRDHLGRAGSRDPGDHHPAGPAQARVPVRQRSGGR